MEEDISQGNMPTSSITDNDSEFCKICGLEPICDGLGVVRYDVPMDDERFGKLFRCPNNHPENDTELHQRLRNIGNLSIFSNMQFENFEIEHPTYTLVQQQSIELAFNSSMRFANSPDGWLLLEGGYGCGKTHLAAAIGNTQLEQGNVVLFITVPDLLDHLRSTYGPSSEIEYDETFDRIRNSYLLILDDLGVENPSHWAQEKLFQLLNHRHSHRLPTVITTNTNIDDLDPRIRSRLIDTHLTTRVRISAPDYRSMAQNQHTQLENNLIHYSQMTFDTFELQRFAEPNERKLLERVLQAAYNYAQEPKGWLLLTGPYGSGKTHLAAAIAIFRETMGDEVMFITAPDLLDYLRKTFSPDSPVRFDQRFRDIKNIQLLILDDLVSENSTPWAKEKLFQLLDYRYITRLPTVITTSKLIEDIDDRISTRLFDDRLCKKYAIAVRSYTIRRKQR
jgi:DNA replication protein DnaC